MKKFLISAAVLLLAFSVQSSAQFRWGVTAGVNLNTDKIEGAALKARTGWNAGMTFMFDLPLGFSLQPSVVYNQKHLNVSKKVVQNMGFVELPVSVQWGPDLLVFRPFLDVTPYIGYAITNKQSIAKDLINVVGGNVVGSIDSRSWEGKQRFGYGVGLGGGFNVWKLQFVARYCWNFGSLYNLKSMSDIQANFADIVVEKDKFEGLNIAVSFFF